MQKYAFNSTFKLWKHLSEKGEYELKISLIIIYAFYTVSSGWHISDYTPTMPD